MKMMVSEPTVAYKVTVMCPVWTRIRETRHTLGSWTASRLAVDDDNDVGRERSRGLGQ